MINFRCVRLILTLCVSLTCLSFGQSPASATPALELKTFIGCVSGEQVFGTWKSPGNADQKALHGTVSAIRIITSSNPMNMSKLAGKLVKVTGRFDGKHSAIRFASNISIIGNCPKVSFTGCVVDAALLITRTTLGPITIAPESWEQIYAAEVKYDKKIIDIANFEGKLVRVIATGMQGGNRVESITASPASDIETVGDCDLKTGLLAVRASQWYEDKADWYIQKKDWQRALSYIDKSITLTPNNCWGYKKRRDIYLALGNAENAEKDLQHLTGTRCATSAGTLVFAKTEKTINERNEYGGKTVASTYSPGDKEYKNGISKSIGYFDNNGKIVKSELYFSEESIPKDGLFRSVAYFDNNGKVVKSEVFFTEESARKNGLFRSIANIENGKVVKTFCYNSNGKEIMCP